MSLNLRLDGNYLTSINLAPKISCKWVGFPEKHKSFVQHNFWLYSVVLSKPQHH